MLQVILVSYTAARIYVMMIELRLLISLAYIRLIPIRFSLSVVTQMLISWDLEVIAVKVEVVGRLCLLDHLSYIKVNYRH